MTNKAESLPVERTRYREYFDSIPRNSIFLLDKGVSELFWDKEISNKGASYFKLPNDCWLVSGESDLIGSWLDFYNKSDNIPVSNILKSKFKWSDKETVRFCISKCIILESSWSVFLEFWDDFLAIDDDCPILIPSNPINREAILFRPIGDILKVS
ncbi:DUF2947 family protein [Endozoicomonas arenosclerae]|uniref:DUF2947 family protein n=1 Tax=Endozoicomonas arenosclerae TaxID=1633495 RepID=UPI000785F418|nr:DUF2947 family protein [Endozoicomonas arenosclerae]